MEENTLQHDLPPLRDLMQAAVGTIKSDIVIQNARLVNVYTGEILDHQSVGIKGKWISYVGPDARHTVGETTTIIDAEQKTLIPGFIDGHTHLAWMYHPSEFMKYVIPGGTTSIVTETMEVFPVAGYSGVLEFLESLKDQPIKIFATAPAMVSISHQSMGVSEDEMNQMLLRDEIVGVGESYWQTVLQHSDVFLPCFETARRHRKTLEGHSAGARGAKLQAYCSAGISSCHEPIQIEEVIERLRLGVWVMIREGSIRRDLETLAAIKDAGVDLRRLILVTDGLDPFDLIEKGCMEYLVQKAIDCGINPVAAIQMATVNPAEHFRLDDRIGGIAPGKFADMAIIPDVKTIRAECVISSGRIIFQDGKPTASPRPFLFSEAARKTVKFDRKLTASDFRIPCSRDTATVRVIDMVTDLVTKEVHLTLQAVNHEIRQDAGQDILKIAAIDRTHFPGKLFTGLIKNFGLKQGAIACSAAWDTSCIVVVGANDSDMAAAVNRIYDLQGGAVISVNGIIEEELALPIFGLISELSVEIMAQTLKKLNAKAVGVRSKNPLLTLVTLTGAAIPYLRICEEGLVNLKDGKTRSLFVTTT